MSVSEVEYIDKNKRHFEEAFSESQIDTNQNNDDDLSLGEPIQLIKISYTGSVSVDPTALDIISSCDEPVGFACLVGKYRTGKSFLLNKLLGLPGNGFRVDSSTNACTEGIWMWSKPVFNDELGNYIFFLDTEGMGSLNRDSTNDAKIFTLATLISSYLMYNSVGSIDDRSINQLNMVTQLSKNILLEDQADLRVNEQNLYRVMPNFIWILRDYMLELETSSGKKISDPSQYLQDVLMEQNTSIKVSESTKKIRRSLLKYFKKRDCMTLVRPANEERDIQNLNYLPLHGLRRQFIAGVDLLREKIQKNTGPKTYNDNPLYGGSIASMIQSYVDSINRGGIPNIKTAWECINNDQGFYAYDRALEQYNELYQQNFQQNQPKGEQIYTVLRAIREASLNEFNRNLSQPNEGYQTKLKQFLNENEDKILDVNKQLIEQKNVQILKQCTAEVVAKIQANEYYDNEEELERDYKEAIANFNHRAKGQSKGEILSEFVSVINPIIISVQNKKKVEDGSLKGFEKEEYEKRIQIMEQRIKGYQDQLKSAQSGKKKKGQEMDTSTVGKKPRSKKPKPQKEPGCCGGGDCLIM